MRIRHRHVPLDSRLTRVMVQSIGPSNSPPRAARGERFQASCRTVAVRPQPWRRIPGGAPSRQWRPLRRAVECALCVCDSIPAVGGWAVRWWFGGPLVVWWSVRILVLRRRACRFVELMALPGLPGRPDARSVPPFCHGGGGGRRGCRAQQKANRGGSRGSNGFPGGRGGEIERFEGAATAVVESRGGWRW